MKKKTNQRTPVEILYYHYFNNVGVSIMKLGEVSKKIAAIIAEGGESVTAIVNAMPLVDKSLLAPIDAKMKALVEEYGEKQAA